MKKNQIMVYRDHSFENQTRTQVEATKTALQELVDQFNILKMGDVASNELAILVQNPQAIFNKRTLSLEVPAGMSRAKYIELYDLPSLQGVTQAREKLMQYPYCMSFELFNLADGSVNIDTAGLETLLDSQSIYVTENTPEHEAVKLITDFAEMLNKVNGVIPEKFLTPNNRNPLTKIVDIHEQPGKGYQASLSKGNIVNFIKYATR